MTNNTLQSLVTGAACRLLDSIYDGVYIVDPDRKIVFWNKGAEAITGFIPQEVMGRSCSDDILNHIDENGRLLCRGHCPIIQTLKTGETIEAKVYPNTFAGVRIPVKTHIAPVRDDHGVIIGAIEVFRDISVEEDFRILQEKFNALISKYVSGATFREVMNTAKTDALSSRSSLRDLTIMYIDVVGFTPFAESHSPQQIVSLLNDLFGVCEVLVRENHGDIDKFIGDAIMAVFVSADDAVKTAMAITQTALPDLNRIRAEEGDSPVQVRIGISSGRVLQGDVGTTERKDLTVLGDVVNTAARLEKAAPPGDFLISEATWSRLEASTSLRYVRGESLNVKGKSEPVPTYRRKQV